MKELLLHVDAFADVDLSAYDEAVFEGAYLHEIFTMAEEEVTELDFGDGYDIDCEPSSFDEEDQTLTVCVNMKASVTLPDDFSGTPDEAFERMQKEITELDFGEAYNIDSRPVRILEQANAMENSIPSEPSYEYNALFSLSCSVPKPVFEALPGTRCLKALAVHMTPSEFQDPNRFTNLQEAEQMVFSYLSARDIQAPSKKDVLDALSFAFHEPISYEDSRMSREAATLYLKLDNDGIPASNIIGEWQAKAELKKGIQDFLDTAETIGLSKTAANKTIMELLRQAGEKHREAAER